jgi:hypothetical protein
VRRLSTMHFELGAEKIMLPFSSLHMAHSVDDLTQITAHGPRP